jgi:hypothetical protein
MDISVCWIILFSHWCNTWLGSLVWGLVMTFRRKGSNPMPPKDGRMFGSYGCLPGCECSSCTKLRNEADREGSKGMEAAEAEIKRLMDRISSLHKEIDRLGDVVEQGLCRYNCRRREDIWKDGFNFAELVEGFTADEAYEEWKNDR